MTYREAKRLARHDAASILARELPERDLEGEDLLRYERAWAEIVEEACARADLYMSGLGMLLDVQEKA